MHNIGLVFVKMGQYSEACNSFEYIMQIFSLFFHCANFFYFISFFHFFSNGTLWNFFQNSYHAQHWAGVCEDGAVQQGLQQLRVHYANFFISKFFHFISFFHFFFFFSNSTLCKFFFQNSHHAQHWAGVCEDGAVQRGLQQLRVHYANFFIMQIFSFHFFFSNSTLCKFFSEFVSCTTLGWCL